MRLLWPYLLFPKLLKIYAIYFEKREEQNKKQCKTRAGIVFLRLFWHSLKKHFVPWHRGANWMNQHFNFQWADKHIWKTAFQFAHIRCYLKTAQTKQHNYYNTKNYLIKWDLIAWLIKDLSKYLRLTVGYNIGVMNSPAEIIRRWCNETVIANYDTHLTDDQLQLLWSAIISIFLIGGCVGSLFAASLADKLGRFVKLIRHLCQLVITIANVNLNQNCVLSRKGALLVCGILFAVGAVFFFLSRVLTLLELLIVGRFIVGLSSGVTTAVLGMYLAEIPPSELRGTLAVFSSIG